jgi:hypothetical protein
MASGGAAKAHPKWSSAAHRQPAHCMFASRRPTSQGHGSRQFFKDRFHGSAITAKRLNKKQKGPVPFRKPGLW